MSEKERGNLNSLSHVFMGEGRVGAFARLSMDKKRLIKFARSMRKDSTDAERRIWFYLRAHRLGGHHFRRQHPIAGYIADFYCDEAKLVVEIDGSQHDEAEALAYDEKRTNELGELGIQVVRFSSYEALKDSEAVAATILDLVEERVKKAPPP